MIEMPDDHVVHLDFFFFADMPFQGIYNPEMELEPAMQGRDILIERRRNKINQVDLAPALGIHVNSLVDLENERGIFEGFDLGDNASRKIRGAIERLAPVREEVAA